MDKLTLTYEQAAATLDQIAAEHPDRDLHKLGGHCVYFFTPSMLRTTQVAAKPGDACCIVGQVLARHGVSIEDLDVDPDTDLNEGHNVQDLVHQGLLDVDRKTQALLGIAQARQDDGDPWADAVRSAHEKIANEDYSLDR